VSPRDREQPDAAVMLVGLFLVGCLVSAPAMAAGAVLGRLLRAHRGWLAATAAASLVGAVPLAPGVAAGMGLGLDAALAAFGDGPAGMVAAGWPHMQVWWLEALVLAPVFGLVCELVRSPKVEELRARAERRQQRRRDRRERRARRAVGIDDCIGAAVGFDLGRHVEGDRLLEVRRGRATMSLNRLAKTTLVVGAPGSGKTETLLRLAGGVAGCSDWSVFVLDAKGDPATLRRFGDLMRATGRPPQLFPGQAYDGWRGEGREIASRLVELIDWADDGPAAYYRDISTNIVRLACTVPAGPPRSSGELLERLDRPMLASLWAGTPTAARVLAFREEHMLGCRARYHAFFDAIDGQLDGSWAFEDTDAGYLLLNELLYGEETAKLARFLLEDFKQYVAARKPAGHKVLLIVDEFSAIATGEDVARMVETVRSYGASFVLAPQAYEGMGGPEAAARIVNAAHTILLHAVPEPDRIASAAGTRMGIESSIQHDQGRALDLGSAREQHQLRVDPNEVRRLTPGMCFAIGSGQAQKLQIVPTEGGPR
jgi:hypothetical protein